MKRPDNAPKERLVKSKERVSKFAEVFTPRWLVEQMWDALDENVEECTPSNSIAHTVLEPTCGEGAFLVVALERRLATCTCDSERLRALSGLYGMDIQEDNIIACRARLRAIMAAFVEDFPKYAHAIDAILSANIICCDALAAMRGMNHEPMLDKRKKPLKDENGGIIYYPEITGFHEWTEKEIEELCGKVQKPTDNN